MSSKAPRSPIEEKLFLHDYCSPSQLQVDRGQRSRSSTQATPHGRILVDKCISTRLRRVRAPSVNHITALPEPKTNMDNLSVTNTRRNSVASSCSSNWEGDREFEELIRNLDSADLEKLQEPANPITKGESAENDVVSGSIAHQKGTNDSFRNANVPQNGKIEEVTVSSSLQQMRIGKIIKPIPRANLTQPIVAGPSQTSNRTIISRSSTMETVRASTPNGDRKVLESLFVRPVQNGSGVKPLIIAHDSSVQNLFDKLGIAWGVQYEIARGVTNGWWTWDDITEAKIKALIGSNRSEAPRVAEVILGNNRKSLHHAELITRAHYFQELDREQAAILEGTGRGLGLMGSFMASKDWYGGRLQFVGRLREATAEERAVTKEPYTVILSKIEKRRSNRVARFLGSRSILQIRMGEQLVNSSGDKIIEYLSRRVILLGRVFYPFHAKDDKVYLVETNEDYERQSVSADGDDRRMSFEEFVKWHNPLELNGSQPISKWSTRWQLLVSTSTPVLEFDPENIYYIDDIYGEGNTELTESIMTDGCGFINLSALRLIAEILGVSIPYIIQGRIAGAKGLWLLHPEHRSVDEPPKIWIRKSQHKVKLPPNSTLGREQRILDLVRLPRLTIPSSLNYLTICNLAYNGVSPLVLMKLLEEGLMEELAELITWEGGNVRTRLAKAIEKAGGVIASRLARQTGLEARTFNWVRDDFDIEGDTAEEEDSTDITRDPYSGCPGNLYESARDMLQAGFRPSTSNLLREKLKHVVRIVSESYLQQYHIRIPLSVEAFVVPDPYDVLNEGEIYFRCSEPINDPSKVVDPYTFSGPVLVHRNPTRVASDIRQVFAVHNDKLLSYVNVIVCSIKGRRSLLSLLAGGDYDGDTVVITAEPEIIKEFSNGPIVNEPPAVREAFEREIELVTAFQERMSSLSREQQNVELCKKLLLGLAEDKVGKYSVFHENAMYSVGYNHPETVRLAYMFTTCLDSSKTGLRVKKECFKQDSLKWSKPRPASLIRQDKDEKSFSSTANDPPLHRDPSLGVFVLDVLQATGRALQKKIFSDYQSRSDSLRESDDEDLLEPYKKELKKANFLAKEKGHTGMLEDIKKIEQFVKEIFNEYVSNVSRQFSMDKDSKIGGKEKSKSPVLMREFSKKFHSGPQDIVFVSELAIPRIKASYAYKLALGRRNSVTAVGFPFNVAHEDLCKIKAEKEGLVAMTREFAMFQTTHATLLKASLRTDATVGFEED